MQAAIRWACGLPAFGIRCEQPSRQWVFQHEDRMNDLRWMSRMVHHLKLTPRQVRLVKENLRLTRLVGVQGKDAINLLARHCNYFPPDLIHINPLATYMKGRFQSEEDTNEYLYHQIDPLFRDFDCGCLGILHTAKTIGKTYEELDDQTRWQYLMSGRANWTNWGRGIIDVMPVDASKKVFGFNASKRGELIGWDTPLSVWKWAPRSVDGERILLWLPGCKASDGIGKVGSVSY
jgi:RecA-family ATPase